MHGERRRPCLRHRQLRPEFAGGRALARPGRQPGRARGRGLADLQAPLRPAHRRVPGSARALGARPTRRGLRAARSGSQHENRDTPRRVRAAPRARAFGSWWSATAWRGMRTVEELLKLAPDLLRHHRVRRRAARQLQPHPALAGARGREDRRRHHRSTRASGTRQNGIALQAGDPVVEHRPRAARGALAEAASRCTTTACCWPRARSRSSFRCRATTCPA